VIAARRAGPADVAAWARFRVAMLRELGLSDPAMPDAELTAAVERWLGERIDSPAFGAFLAELDGEGGWYSEQG
jgi:hypothetical protein